MAICIAQKPAGTKNHGKVATIANDGKSRYEVPQ
jgi:hypothetical protein